MPRRPSPWFWEARNAWYFTQDGKQNLIAKREPVEPKPKKGKTGWNAPPRIKKLFSDIMHDETPPDLGGDSVAAILDDFITWCHENRAPKTTQRYQDFCQAFVEKYGIMSVSQLHTGHVTTWLYERTTWGATTKHNAITAIVRAFNWAVKNRGLKSNPISGMDKPKPNRRTDTVTPEEFDDILSHYEDGDPFKDLMIASYDSGSRPHEVKNLEARQVDFEKQRAVITADDGAKGGITRVVYFPTERSMEIINRLAKKHPDGLMFRNAKGTPWNGFNVRCRFQRLQSKTGKRFHHYMMRHTFVTRKLVAGVDSHVVAKLAGHQNTSMLDKVYSHVADDYDFMLQAAKTGEDDAASAEDGKPASRKQPDKKQGTKKGQRPKS